RDTGVASMALMFGVKLPTGDEDETGFQSEIFVRRVDTGVVQDHGHGDAGHHHQGNLLEAHQQPGSGSYDPIVGFAYSRQFASLNMDSSLVYTMTNEGSQQTDQGDSFKYNLALAYPLNGSLDLVMEVNGEWRDQEVRGSAVIENSGGSHTYVSPGMRYRFRDGWSASVSYGMPVYENINGFQSEPDKRWIGTLSFSF
ncbi:MAG: transporter, partial [Gammaproteobacteria bacterium]